MMILSEKDPIETFSKACYILFDAVKHTLGPYGTNTAVQTRNGHYDIINDGKTIIEKVTSLEPELAPAIETLKKASFSTNTIAGDGTTSTVILMYTLLKKCEEMLKESDDKTELRGILLTMCNRLIDIVDTKLKKEVEVKDYVNVAKIALGGEKYAKELADAFEFLNKGQRPLIMKSDIPDVQIEKKDGLVLNRIMVPSEIFLQQKEFNGKIRCYLVYESINRMQQLTNLLKKAIEHSNNGATVLLFYYEMSVEVIENLMLNYSQGRINIIPIRLGAYSTNTYKVFEAISEYTGASIIDGINSTINPLKNLEEGYISYATLDRDAVLIKCDDYDGELNLEADNLDLTNRSVIMRVGGSNEVEREEVYRRIEDAVNSLSNAIEYGIVPGAGKCYVQAYNELDPDNRMKFREVLSCIQDTLENNGLNTKDVGEDVIDSVTVVEQVIRNAFTMVAQVITTDKMIHDNIR